MSTTTFNANDLIIHQRSELVFIDGNVADINTLIASIGAGKEVHILDAGQDGLTQIASLLQGRSGIDALHIISHGSAGQAQLGTLSLDSSTATTRAADLAAIGSHLTNSGDMLFYGCEVGAGSTGQALLDQLAITTGADIAASTNMTGNAALGGDWNLELVQGNIDAAPLIDLAYADFYESVLPIANVTIDFSNSSNLSSSGGNLYYSINGDSSYRLKLDAQNGYVTKNSGGAWINTVYNESRLTITLPGGQFSPTSIDVGGSTFTLVARGYAANGSQVGGDITNSITIGTQAFGALSSASIQKLVIMRQFGAGMPALQLDNLVLTNVSLFNAAPTIGGITTTTTINDTATTTPFSAVTIADANDDNVSVTVTLDTQAKGVLGSLGSFTDNGNGSYTLASTTAATAQAAIRQLEFNPADNRVGVGSTEMTTFTIAVNDGTATKTSNTTTVTSTSVNDTPTDIALTNATATVHDPANATVGALSSADPDPSDTFTYSLVSGTGDTDNALFNISGSNLRANNPAALTAGNYSVLVRTTDANSATYERALAITVSDAPLVVTTNLDSGDDYTTGGGYAAELADGGGLSLREALALASAGGKTISFAAGLDGQSIVLSNSQLLNIPAGTVLDADVANNLTIRYDSAAPGNTAKPVLAGDLTIRNGAGDTLTFGPFHSMSGTGTLTKAGAGTLVFGASASSTLSGFTGGINIAEGTIQLGKPNTIITAALTIAAGATLDFNDHDETFTSLAGAGTIANNTGWGSLYLDLASGSRSTFTGSMSGSYSGLVVRGSGTLELGGSSTYSAGGDIAVNSGATIELNKSSGTAGASRFTLGSSGGSTPDTAVLRWLGNDQISTTSQYWIYKTGLLDLNGFSQTASSTFRLQGGGEIRTGAGTLNLTGATFNQGSAETFDINGQLKLNPGTTTFSTGTGLIDVSANISGTGNLQVSGTGVLQLGGTASYSGTTNVTAGTLRIAGDGNIGSGALNHSGGTLLVTGSNVTIDNNIALTNTSTIDNANNLTLSGVLSSTGNLSKTGAGTLTLGNTNTNNGTLTVNAGALQLDGSLAGAVTIATGANLVGGGANQAAGAVTGNVTVESGGTFSPGASGGSGVADVKTGNLAIASGGTLAMTLNGATTPGTDYDQIITTGTVNITGATLSVSGSASAAPGTVFTLINNDGSDAVTGTFNGLAEGATVTVNGVGMTISYTGGTGNDVTLTRQAVNLLMANLNNDTHAWPGVGNTVTLDASANVTVADDTHDASNWNGVTLTVQRNGTAVTSDVLAIAAGSGYTVSGSNLQAGGLTFATFTSANGVLTITFANPGAGGTDATNALVQDVLRKISYQNDTPAGNATLRFSLVDGTNSSTTDVTVTTDKIYVTAATDTAVDNLNDGVSFSEALRLANAQTGTETLVLQADLANQTVGAANVASLTGSVIVDADAASGATISSGTLNTNGQILTVTNGSGDTLTVATTLSGTGNLAKTGAGAAILTGTNTYSGTTAVTGGKITANGSSSLGTSAVTLDSGTLGFGATNDWTIANAITLGAGGGTLESSAGNNSGVTTVSGVLSGGNLTLTNGSGAQIGLVKLTGTNTYTGTTTLALTPSGLVQINGDENLGGGNIIFNNGKLGILSDTVIDNNIQTSGASATFSIASGTTTEIAGVISGNRDLSSEGNGGTLKLSGINTYTGSTRVGNTLIASSDAALPDGTLLELGGTLTLLSNQTVGALNSFYGPLSTSVINLDTHTLTLGGNNASNFAGAINGSGNLVKNGAGTFVVTSTTARANEGNHSGNITINGGVLQLDGTLKGAINVASGGKLTGGGADATAGDALDNVSVASGGTLSPGGSGGIATADIKTGNLSIASGATLAMNISGTNAGATSSGYDQIITTGTVDVTDATLTMIGSYNAVVGDSFVLVSNDSNDAVTGTFNGLAEGAIVTVNGTPMKLSYVGGTGNDITLTAQMTFSGLAISADTGSVTTDFITNTAAQTISATLSSALGSTGVTIWGSVDNGVNWTNVTTMVSDTTLTWTGESLSGTSTLKLEARNASSAVVGSTSQAYELDTTAPGTTIATKAFSADTGTSSTDFITKTAAQTISGTLSAITVAGETVQVSLDNGSTWVDATNTTGENTWSLAGQTLTASNTLKVRVADTAGNTGTEASQAYVLDQGAPTNTFSALGISADTGISTTDFKTSTAGQTITATLSGPVVGTDKVWGSTNNGSTWTDVTAMVSGTTLTWTGATLSGSSTIKLKVSDDAGNDGTVASVAYVLDTAVPTASVTTANVGIGSNVTTSQSTETGIIYLVQSTATPVSYAQLESLLTAPAAATKATVTTINTNTALGTTGLTAGTYKVYAVDAAGNISAASANTITLGAPPTTVANAASLSDDTGISNTDLITQTAAQTISGTLSAVTVAGETIQVSLDNGSNWVNATNTIGESTWTLAGQTLAGSNTLQVRVTNVAGFSNSPYTHTYSIDTTAPTTTVASKAFSNDTGTSNTDFITKTAAQTISGTLSANMVAGEIVQVSLDNGSTWTTATTTPGQNTWSLAGQTLTGNDTLKVRVTDTAGNTGTEASQTYTLDQTGPAITFSTLSISADTGASTTDFITQTAAQTISATLSGAPAGTDIVYGSLDNGATWTDITNKVSGTTLTWDGVSLTGSGTLKLKVTDLAGSDGTISSQVYVLDTTAPTFNPGAGTPADNATSVSTTAPIVVHFSEPLHSSSVLGQVYLKTVANDGGVPATVTLSGNGDVVITPLAPLSNSTAYYVSWDANALKDAAGNVGTAVADQTTLNFTTAAVVIPPPDPTPTPTPPNVNDSDNVPAAVENQTPSLPNAGGTTVTGDGNGDGVADSAQSNVTSTSFLKTGQVTTDTTAQVTFVSLVADSKDGAIDTTDTTNAVLTNIVQNDAPANLPAGITMPLGLISFTATVGTSSTATGSAPGVGINETFSLFVDASLGVNGYWKQNAAGTWVNLASDVHGGNLVTVGNRMRLDFQIQDGGEFDADGKVDGIITDPGAAGYLPQSLLSHIPELPQDSFWF